MINKFLETLYSKVFINIIVDNSHTTVYIEVCSKNNIVDTIEKTFKTTGINTKVYEFVKLYAKESPFNYISVLDNSPSQGAIPTSKSSEMGIYTDIDSTKTISLNDWSVYSSEYDLNSIVNEYESIGVDFIFSPFLIMSRFFKDKINNTLSMFILIESNYLSMAIFDNSHLLYGEYIDVRHQNDDDLLMNASLDDDSTDIGDINLDEIDIDEDSSLDDFADIEDLDSTSEINEFSEAKEIKEVQHDAADDTIDSVGFDEDYKRFLLIQHSLNIFYKDDKYDSQFIEHVYIADSIGITNSLKKYLEEEMFLSVYVRKIELCVEVSEMAKAELNEI